LEHCEFDVDVQAVEAYWVLAQAVHIVHVVSACRVHTAVR
jgi:hypothetical protein